MEKDTDYYFNENGLMVFTKEYHLKRGYCCKNECKNCPWNYIKKTNKNTAHLPKKTPKN